MACVQEPSVPPRALGHTYTEKQAFGSTEVKENVDLKNLDYGGPIKLN